MKFNPCNVSCIRQKLEIKMNKEKEQIPNAHQWELYQEEFLQVQTSRCPISAGFHKSSWWHLWSHNQSTENLPDLLLEVLQKSKEVNSFHPLMSRSACPLYNKDFVGNSSKWRTIAAACKKAICASYTRFTQERYLKQYFIM